MKRVVLTLFWVLAATLVCSAQTTFYFPHVADGGGWKTTIFITNPAASGSAAVSGSVTFTASNGTALNLSFVNASGNSVGSGNTLPFQLAGGQTAKFVSSGAGGDIRSGFATVTATGSVTGTAVFSQFAGSTLTGEAGVPSASLAARQSIFVDEQGGFNTGVAYANPGTGSADITLRLLNTEGVSVISTTRVLGPNQHTAGFVSQIFGAPSAGVTGTMQITTTSATPLATIALRFDPSFQRFTTLPPITLAGIMSPVFQWFEKTMPSPLAAFARLLGGIRIG